MELGTASILVQLLLIFVLPTTQLRWDRTKTTGAAAPKAARGPKTTQ